MEVQKKKVLLAIMSSNSDLYTKNTNVLKGIYRKMIETFDLSEISVDVISYTAGEKTELVGDTLYIDCLDSDIYLKSRIFCEYLLQHPEYDYIIRTNATTLVNLSYVNAFIKEGYFDENTFYGTSMIRQGMKEYTYSSMIFIPGQVIMSTGKDFREKLCNLETHARIYQEQKEFWKNTIGLPQAGDTIWKGVPDDVVFGLMLYEYDDIKLVSVDERIILSSIFGGYRWQTLDDILNSANGRNLFINVKLGDIPHETRAKLEPILLTLFGRTMLQDPVTNIGRFIYHYNIVGKNK